VIKPEEILYTAP